MQADFVVDEGSFPHFNGKRRNDMEAQPRRGQLLEILGIGEEREDLFQSLRQPFF